MVLCPTPIEPDIIHCPEAEAQMAELCRRIIKEAKGQIKSLSYRLERTNGDYISYQHGDRV